MRSAGCGCAERGRAASFTDTTGRRLISSSNIATGPLGRLGLRPLAGTVEHRVRFGGVFGMCGITGCWVRSAVSESDLRARVQAMADSLSYRGPDDAGVWVSGPVGFGHRRLSIIDLSPLGHQPMADPSGRFTICFNGEIFNFKSVRDQLAGLGHTFSGGSDTEVMLAAFVEWGVVRALDSFVGMFAFSVWDARERTLHLVRDRLGIKPLFVGQTPDGDLLFGSELKALMADPGLERRIDPAAVVSYLRLGYVPSPASVFAGVIKLPPGHVLTVRSPYESLDPQPFWTLPIVASNGRHSPFTGDETEAEEELKRLLGEAVGLRMIADVPLGAFLSGGIDSSLVVALM